MFIIVDMMEKTRTDGFCLFCSKADLNSNDFGCGEPIGLCGTCDILILCKFICFIPSLYFFFKRSDGIEGSFCLIRVMFPCDKPLLY